MELTKIFFVPNRRKGYSSFKVVDRSNKSQRSNVNLLPSALPLEHVQPNEQPMQEEIREEEEGEYLCGDKPESEEDLVPTAYQMQRDRLSKHWKALRMTLLNSFLQL